MFRHFNLIFLKIAPDKERCEQLQRTHIVFPNSESITLGAVIGQFGGLISTRDLLRQWVTRRSRCLSCFIVDGFGIIKGSSRGPSSGQKATIQVHIKERDMESRMVYTPVENSKSYNLDTSA